MKPQTLSNGSTLVKRMENFENWCAWRFWLHRETGRTWFPDKLCVWGDWPPETMQLAETVCQTVADARRKVGYEFPVCDPAQPWDRWSFAERDELTRKHRADPFWIPPLPETRTRKRSGPYETANQREVLEWMDRQAAQLPRVPRGKGLPWLRAMMADVKDAAQ